MLDQATKLGAQLSLGLLGLYGTYLTVMKKLSLFSSSFISLKVIFCVNIFGVSQFEHQKEDFSRNLIVLLFLYHSSLYSDPLYPQFPVHRH